MNILIFVIASLTCILSKTTIASLFNHMPVQGILHRCSVDVVMVNINNQLTLIKEDVREIILYILGVSGLIS